MDIRNVDCLDYFTLGISVCNLLGHLLVQVVDEVVVCEALWLRCENFVYDLVQVLLFDLHVLADTHDLIAPALLA